MMKRLFLLVVVLLLSTPAHTQDAAAELLARVNNLRASLGLPPYAWNAALAAAAANHARWMVEHRQVSHVQFDGSTPRTRARAAGYGSQSVSENIFMGSRASVDSAWNFWMNSSVHYAGLTNARFNEVGIAWATGAGGQAYVMVFGNSSGSWPAPVAARPGSAAAAAPRVLPIVGVDNVGNIMYEVQAGDDLGTIAFLFGYDWEDIPAMMALNGMTWEDSRVMRVGSVFLVPPADGTFTPTPSPTRDPSIPTETATPTVTPTPTITPTPTDLPPAIFVQPSPAPTRPLVIRTLEPSSVVAMVAAPAPPAAHPPHGSPGGAPAWVIAALVVQVAVIFGAAFQYFRRR